MALIKCSECGNQVSDKAASCPKCGAPVQISIQAKELIKCSECGKEVSSKANSCPECGAPIQTSPQKKEPEKQPQPEPPPTQPPPQPKTSNLNQHQGTETNYYSDSNGVRVTNTRFILPATTYPMQGITSIRTQIIEPNKTFPILFIVIGIILAFCGFSGNNNSSFLIWGLILGGIGIIWLISLKDTFGVAITTASGEHSPLTSKDEEYIRKVAAALNEAIVHRG